MLIFVKLCAKMPKMAIFGLSTPPGGGGQIFFGLQNPFAWLQPRPKPCPSWLWRFDPRLILIHLMAKNGEMGLEITNV